MTDKQPEALRLADALKDDGEWLRKTEKIFLSCMFDSAELLASQHAALAKNDAAIKELREALQRCRGMVGHPDNIALIDAAIANTGDGGETPNVELTGRPHDGPGA